MTTTPLVLDFGTHSIKLGRAGQVLPSTIYPSAVGLPRVPGKVSLESIGVFPLNEEEKLDHTKIVYPFVPHAEYSEVNEEALITILSHLGNDRVAKETPISPDSAVLLAEPTAEVRRFQDVAVEVLFETLQIQSLLPQRCAALAAYANARESGVVVEMGYQKTTCSVVTNGLISKSSIQTNPMGGKTLVRIVNASLGDVKCPPMFQIKEDPPIPHPFIEEDYNLWSVEQFISRMLFDEPFATGIKESMLPDGVPLSSAFEKIDLPGLITDPGPLQHRYPGLVDYLGTEQPIAETMLNAICSHGVSSLTPDILNSVMTTGGLAVLPSILASLEESIELCQAKRVQNGDVDPFAGLPAIPIWGETRKAPVGPSVWGWRLLGSLEPQERRHAAWIGGSIVGSLGVFSSVAVTKAVYAESGDTAMWRTLLS